MFSSINNFFGFLKSSQNTYHTNIVNLTCNCEDWKQKRKDYPDYDPRRLCKHIVKNLDTNNLPSSIKYYKETIQYYQNNEKGFNKLDFDKVIRLLKNDLIVLGSDKDIYENWMNVYDKTGNQYGFFASGWGGFIWAKDKKPNGYEEVEEYFSQPSMQLPLRLQEEEKEDVIQFIKEKIQSKRDSYLQIVDDQYVPSSSGIYYYLSESKRSSKYDQYTEVRNIIVNNNEIIIEMYMGEKYIYKRDYIKAKLIEEKKRFLEKDNLRKQEQEWEENLAIKRKEAKEKGYLYNIKDTTYCEVTKGMNDYEAGICYANYTNTLEKISNDYLETKQILNSLNTKITLAQFNIALKNLHMITKLKGLNLNNWILINEGLLYGMNMVKESKYFSPNIPDWYEIKTIDCKTFHLINEIDRNNVRMTKILWKKDKFSELLHLVLQNIENETKTNKIISKSAKKLEREEWLQFVECPHCASKNIHKKNKRVYGYGEVQRYQCMDCKRIFQIQT